jgi:two-component system, sensor histidine kinase and response regulator
MESRYSKKITLLYVEDEQSILDELIPILERYVDSVYSAKNGEEALRIYHKIGPDIILTDLEMPIMNGLEFIKKIREVDTKVPVLINTAFNENRFLQDAIFLNVRHYLLKPINIKHLKEILSHIKDELYRDRELIAYRTSLEVQVNKAINESKHKSQLLAQQNKSAEIGTMMCVVAHQWKQPLNVLSLIIQDVKEAYTEEEIDSNYINDFIKDGMNSVNFMSETITHLLSFYQDKGSIKPFSVKDSVNAIIQIFAPALEKHRICIDVVVVQDFTLLAIENDLMQVILNLVANAKDAIEAKALQSGKIVITIDNKCITVEDNGGGLKEDILEKIFEMNYTTKEGGSGIGLSLVKSLVEDKLHGNISVENIQEGARFTVLF